MVQIRIGVKKRQWPKGAIKCDGKWAGKSENFFFEEPKISFAASVRLPAENCYLYRVDGIKVNEKKYVEGYFAAPFPFYPKYPH